MQTGAVRRGMLVLADRYFTGFSQVSQIVRTGAHLIFRTSSRRKLPVFAELADGSYRLVLPGPVYSVKTFIWDQCHLLQALRGFESFYNGHRPHRALRQAAPLRPLPAPITEPGQIRHLEVHRRDRLGGTLYEHRHAA